MIHLKDYKPYPWNLESVELDFKIFDDYVILNCKLSFAAHETVADLVLDGEALELETIRCNGRLLDTKDYTIADGQLVIFDAPQQCVIETQVRLYPDSNTRLDGLYRSHGLYCTQCEAQGFRRITFFPDRPDVSSIYTVRVEANKEQNPLLLSNGNQIEQGDLGERHFVIFHDPFPKPCYLFALVAGELASKSQQYTTADGNIVQLCIHAQQHNIDKCDFAMESLIKSMRWDEQRFGLNYDLDVFHIVGVDYFNSGAMENKGLNIFNAKLIFADAEIATDLDYERVEAVVAHEYFHNWTGNRVTCRDWFQLTLKEGLTVFRDQEFTADVRDHSIKRVEDALLLFEHQFIEDSGSLAHPIKPKSYEAVNNLYTLTVYEKGAEVVRLYQTIIGKENFSQGLQHYLQKHDGSGATTEDFRKAMEQVSNKDLTLMDRWYNQAGTPQLSLKTCYDSKGLTITLEQDQNPPLPIPFSYGVVGKEGTPLLSEQMELLTTSHKEWTIADVTEDAVLSPLRGLSAPVKLNWNTSLDNWVHLLRFDEDDYNRWYAARQIYKAILGEDVDSTLLLEVLAELIDNKFIRPRLASLLLTVPTIQSLLLEYRDIDQLCAKRLELILNIGQTLQQPLTNCYQRSNHALPAEYQPSAHDIGWRTLKKTALLYITQCEPELAFTQYNNATNATERLAAMQAILSRPNPLCPRREQLLADYYRRYKDESLMLDRWFTLSVSIPRADSLQQFNALLGHADYDNKLPNRVRALIGGLMHNPYAFHFSDGAAYQSVIEALLQVDSQNPQTAARLFAQFDGVQRLDTKRQGQLKSTLQGIVDSCSTNSKEHVAKIIASLKAS